MIINAFETFATFYLFYFYFFIVYFFILFFIFIFLIANTFIILKRVLNFSNALQIFKARCSGADPEGLPPGGECGVGTGLKSDLGGGGDPPHSNGGSGVPPEQILFFACVLVASEIIGISHLQHIILRKNYAW